MMTERFKKFFEQMLENEGGYSDDPEDPGGKTFWGITEKNYPSQYKQIKNLYDSGKKELAKDMVMRFYHKEFYYILYDRIEDEFIAFKIFDLGVNLGQIRAVILLQESLKSLGFNIKADGVFGEATLKAVNEADREELYQKYIEKVGNYYYSLEKPRFIKGWINRLNRKYKYAGKIIDES
jgi:lysozyme family protein